MSIEQTKSNKLLRIADVSAKTTIAKSTLWLMMSENRFPKPVKLSGSINVWRESDIDAWIDEKFGDKHE
jgi:prophage regulatory protein